MNELSALEPKRVFRHFERICAIPHGSGNGQAIGDYCARFAAAHGLRCLRDAYGNVVIFKDGNREKAPMILQGHLDMVCEKSYDYDAKHDFKKDGLNLQVLDDSIFAKGTTLGADDGIAVAYMLAILDDVALRFDRRELVVP